MEKGRFLRSNSWITLWIHWESKQLSSLANIASNQYIQPMENSSQKLKRAVIARFPLSKNSEIAINTCTQAYPITST